MAWRRPGDKPLSEPMMVNLPTHICIIRQSINWKNYTNDLHSFIRFGLPDWCNWQWGKQDNLLLTTWWLYMWCWQVKSTYSDVIMSTVASQITSLMIVYSTTHSGADPREHQSSASLAFVREIHRGPVNSPHKRPVTWKMFPVDDIIMSWQHDGYICSVDRLNQAKNRDRYDTVYMPLFVLLIIKDVILCFTCNHLSGYICHLMKTTSKYVYMISLLAW